MIAANTANSPSTASTTVRTASLNSSADMPAPSPMLPPTTMPATPHCFRNFASRIKPATSMRSSSAKGVNMGGITPRSSRKSVNTPPQSTQNLKLTLHLESVNNNGMYSDIKTRAPRVPEFRIPQPTRYLGERPSSRAFPEKQNRTPVMSVRSKVPIGHEPGLARIQSQLYSYRFHFGVLLQAVFAHLSSD